MPQDRWRPSGAPILRRACIAGPLPNGRPNDAAVYCLPRCHVAVESRGLLQDQVNHVRLHCASGDAGATADAEAGQVPVTQRRAARAHTRRTDGGQIGGPTHRRTDPQRQQRAALTDGPSMVELRGIEPLTFSLRTRRATNCATAPSPLAERRSEYHFEAAAQEPGRRHRRRRPIGRRRRATASWPPECQPRTRASSRRGSCRPSPCHRSQVPAERPAAPGCRPSCRRDPAPSRQ